MASNWEGLDNLGANLIPSLREAMDRVALQGEQLVKSSGEIGIDTGSLIASVTGYEAEIGDPFRNFDDEAWMIARDVGNAAYQSGKGRYRNPPIHYAPFEEELAVDTTNPTAVVSIFTRYPGGDMGSITGMGVDAALQGALAYMGEQVVPELEKIFGGSNP